MDDKIPLLEIHDVEITFRKNKHIVRAVQGVSLVVQKGTTLGIVGESGSGKSTLARAVMQLIPITSGNIEFGGVDLASLSKKQLRVYRKQMQMVFQDPGGSLNEYMKVGQIVSEPLLVHGIARGSKLLDLAADLLEQVGLNRADIYRYPHEFSGGQKQRVAIARAIALHPKLLVCDEPTSALDVSVQAKVLDLLCNLRDEFALTIMFISHNLAVVHQFCDEIVVMSQGKIVEHGTAKDIIYSPKHEVTKELVASSQDWNLSNSPSIML